jgi:hypothetical protein
MRAHVGEADPERCRDPAVPQDRAVRVCHKDWVADLISQKIELTHSNAF